MEHVFGRNLMGRWKILNEWRYSLGFLEDATACMMIATNVELFLRHGNRGRYNPMTTEKIAVLNNKAQYHVMQDVRYPYSDPLPSLKDEHAEMEKAIAKNREEHEKADSEEVARKARPKPSVGHAPHQASTDLLDQESTEELTTEEQEKKAEEKEKRTAAQAEKRANKKRQLVLEGKELLGFRKKNEDAQARKEGLKRAKEEVDPRITEQAVERRIMKRINDAKRRKNNLEDEI